MYGSARCRKVAGCQRTQQLIKKAFFFFLIFPALASAFVVSPWFTPIAEFQFRPSYSYRYYPSVNRGFNPSSYNSHDHLIDLNLGVRFLPSWDFQMELDFSDTRRLSWGTQRFGTQIRYQWLDDVAGDPISLVLGLQLFYVPTRNMRDVSSPYHAQGDLELGVAIGKELDRTYDWVWRFYGFLGVGTGNRGYPWLRPLLSSEFKFRQHHKLQLLGEGYFGFGNRHDVNINRFNGYAKILHQSIDLALNYTYIFNIWGELGVQYAYRVYAHAFPQHASTFTLEYRLPFSLF